MAAVQLMGQASQIPVAPRPVRDRTRASVTRRIRSVKVAAMNRPMLPVPRSTPSAVSLADTTK